MKQPFAQTFSKNRANQAFIQERPLRRTRPDFGPKDMMNILHGSEGCKERDMLKTSKVPDIQRLSKLDDRQITHLICARLKYDLYDFFRGCFGPASSLFLV